jgi:hypothetical protein
MPGFFLFANLEGFLPVRRGQPARQGSASSLDGAEHLAEQKSRAEQAKAQRAWGAEGATAPARSEDAPRAERGAQTAETADGATERPARTERGRFARGKARRNERSNGGEAHRRRVQGARNTPDRAD